MKMRKIDLTPFTIEVVVSDRDSAGGTQFRTIVQQYPFISNVVEITLSAKNQVTARQLLERNMVCQKLIEAERAGQTELLLLDTEYESLKTSVENFVGLGKQDLEMVKRILNAPQVEEANKGGE